VEANRILFQGHGANHLMIVLTHCAGAVSLTVITTCPCQYYTIFSTTEFLLTFLIIITAILPAPELMNCLLFLHHPLLKVSVIPFLCVNAVFCHFVEHFVFRYTIKCVHFRAAMNVKFSIQIFGCLNERIPNNLVMLKFMQKLQNSSIYYLHT